MSAASGRAAGSRESSATHRSSSSAGTRLALEGTIEEGLVELPEDRQEGDQRESAEDGDEGPDLHGLPGSSRRRLSPV